MVAPATPYSDILSGKRARLSTMQSRSMPVEAESDRGRLVFSAPFRRLQQKAQVFSLEVNAAVRSRLTHSIEVAQIGRFIADQIVEALTEQGLVDATQARAMVTFVEVACLMHDLGNPPFGHFGERAIAQWFRTNGERCLATATSDHEGAYLDARETAVADFVEFDGNCQGLRIASLLQWNGDPCGLNLTFTSLAAYLKYVRAPLFNASEEIKKQPFQKKAGFFSTEAALVRQIWEHFGIDPAKPRRFPLAYIMEAADDIAYCISDLEDSVEKGLLDIDRIFPEIQKLWHAATSGGPADSPTQEISNILERAAHPESEQISRFTNFRTGLSRALSEFASRTYCLEHSGVLSGRLSGLISDSGSGGKFLQLLKDYCQANVYQNPSIERKELAGLAAVRGLLEHFKCLLTCSSDRFLAALDGRRRDENGQAILEERKLLNLFPERYKLAYRHCLNKLTETGPERARREWNLRAHLVTDFISGMTDDFALRSFQTLSGIRTS